MIRKSISFLFTLFLAAPFFNCAAEHENITPSDVAESEELHLISANDIKDDLKVTVSSGKSSSNQTGEGIEKSFDNDMNTLYHSLWNNAATDYFPITLEYFFEKQEAIDYLVVHPRTSGSNGLFKETEIWVATEEHPSYTKIMDYDFKAVRTPTRISFEMRLIKPKSIKFIVKSGAGDGQGFASCAEMEFYRKNPDNFDPLVLFTDLTCTQLKPGITENDIEKVQNKLYRTIALHILKGTYPREFRIQDYKAWPHPDDWAKINKTSILSLLDNPTGISVSNGDDLIAFVGESAGYPISLKVQDLDIPGGDGYNNASYYPLSPGVNKIRVRNKGLVYLLYHTADWQKAPPIKIHFATGKVNGYFDSGKHQTTEWTRLIQGATDTYFDVLGEHAHLTFPTNDLKTYAAGNGNNLIGTYDELVRLEKEFMGLMKYNRPTGNRAYFHAINTSYMYSTSYRTAYNMNGENVKKTLLDWRQLKLSPWGPAHEMGHTFQTQPGFKWHGMTEVTNNLHSLYVQTQWGNISRLESEKLGRYNNRYEKAFQNSFVKNIPYPREGDVFCKLVSLWQLQLYFAGICGYGDIYKDLYERIRTSPDMATPGEQQLEFVKIMCDITKTDLTGFFGKWGYLQPFDQTVDDYGQKRLQVTQTQIDRTFAEIKAKGYPIIIDKIEYICDANLEIFKNRSSVQTGTASKNGTTITMTDWKNVVAYEVYEGDQLIFVTNESSFNLDSPATNATKVLAIAYDGSKTTVIF